MAYDRMTKAALESVGIEASMVQSVVIGSLVEEHLGLQHLEPRRHCERAQLDGAFLKAPWLAVR